MFHFRVPFFISILTAGICALGVTDAAAQSTCGPLPAPSGFIVDVTPAQVASLQSILDAAQPGHTIRLADGVYSLPQTLVMRVAGVTLRSKSGNRSGVVLDGRYAIGNVVQVQKSNVTIADLTLTRANWHLVHVAPEGPLTATLLHNVRGVDGSQQFIKVNPVNGAYADNGVIRCSSLELTDAGRPYVRNNCYTGGIDLHQARGWQVHANVVTGFWCGSGLSEHAIHAWTGSRDTRVERNIIINSARGIGFGLGAAVSGRTYSDAPCGGAVSVGHYGGGIVNNVIVANDARLFASAAGFDTGIGLEQSCESNVLHNTVVSTSAPRSSSIEWRFTNTVAAIANNLATHTLVARDGARGSLGGNIANAPLTMFVNAAAANVHLVAGATAAIDKAAPLTTPVTIDIDGDTRRLPADVGADEYVAPATTMSLSATSPVLTGGTIAASWTMAAGTASWNDWVGLYASGADDGAAIARGMTGGQASGTVFFTAPAMPGTYEARYFKGNNTRLAVSPAITVTAPAPAVDTTPPVVRITSPVNGQRVSSTIYVTVSATDNVRVAGVELYVNGVRTASSTTAPFTTAWGASSAAAGTHILQVRAFDAAGNVAWSPAVTVMR